MCVDGSILSAPHRSGPVEPASALAGAKRAANDHGKREGQAVNAMAKIPTARMRLDGSIRA